MAYYQWCVNCGGLGSTPRKSVSCQNCDYTGIAELDFEEFERLCIQRHREDLLGKNVQPITTEPSVVYSPAVLKGVMEA